MTIWAVLAIYLLIGAISSLASRLYDGHPYGIGDYLLFITIWPILVPLFFCVVAGEVYDKLNKVRF